MILESNEVGFTIEQYAESIMDPHKYEEICDFLYPDDFTCEKIDIIDTFPLSKIEKL